MKKILFIYFIFFNCWQHTWGQKPNPVGLWRAKIITNGGELPFGLEITLAQKANTYQVFALNGDEKLQMDNARLLKDSLHIPMQMFDSELIAKLSANKLNGYWRKRRANGTYLTLKFEADKGSTYRFFDTVNNNTFDFSGKYKTLFISADKQDSTLAIGVFRQKNGDLKGTFLTPTGDYRYLAGNAKGDSLFLSCFDGTHAFLFKAKYNAAIHAIVGQFWSNGSNLENWTAFLDDQATLPDEKSFTYLKNGFSELTFSFPNTANKLISIKDSKYKNKVLIVQIMGSWCPNCMDESRFLAPWYNKNKYRGVEIIGLSFEKYTDAATAFPKIIAMKNRFGISYEVLFAGSNDKENTAEALPMLNRIVGFPTTIFIDKRGKVREIHTGFSGPSTGEYYDKFVSNFNDLVNKLLQEK